MKATATVVEVVRRHAALRGDRTFLVTPGPARRRAFTYASFDALTGRIAAGMRAEGLARGDRLALLLDNRHAAAFYLLLIAAYKAGVVAVPLNPRLAPQEVAFVARDATLSRLVATEAGHGALAGQDVGGCQPWGVDVIWQLAERATASGPRAPALDDVADILYTSGTTSTPKGAVFAHRTPALFGEAMAHALRLRSDDVYQTAAPVYTSTGVRTCLTPVLHVGGTLVVEEGFDVEAAATVLEGEGSTAYFGVPSMFTLLLERLEPSRVFPRVRSLYYGGSPMPREVIRRLPERFPNAGLFNMYGLTEGGPNGCVLPPEHALVRSGSVGHPLDGTELRVVDDDGRELPLGEAGELLMRSPTLMLGYLDRPAETHRTVVDGWLHTGDVAAIDPEGFVSILGRKKDIIIRGGFNVSPAEVEAVLADHPDVFEVAVVGVPHLVLGEDVGAVVVWRDGASASQADLEALCSTRLADFKRPRHYRFVDALPRNAMGKVLKRELRDRWAREEIGR